MNVKLAVMYEKIIKGVILIKDGKKEDHSVELW